MRSRIWDRAAMFHRTISELPLLLYFLAAIEMLNDGTRKNYIDIIIIRSAAERSSY